MVYLDTAVPSFFFEERKDLRSQHWRSATRAWWASRHRYNVVTSDFVLEELAGAPLSKQEAAIDLLVDIPRLDVPVGFDAVVQHYVQNRLVPADVRGDAAHLALASLHRADFLLTWNLRHLANPNKRRHIRVINSALGLSTPEITTPEELLSMEDAS